jgi:predicted DNA-binding transcriptional regulator YafY
MERTERFYKIDQLLRRRRATSLAVLQRELEVSRATIKRDLQYLRSRMHAPIEWDRQSGGYRFAPRGTPGQQSASRELPGLWFSSSEIQALLTMQQLLIGLDPAGVLATHIAPLRERLNTLLAESGPSQAEAAELRRRVRIIGLAQRNVQPKHFQRVGAALLQRKRLQITYQARGTGAATQREVSPLRLVHYRDNWYLDAWCHLRRALRNFAVDAIQQATLLNLPAKDVSDARLDALFGPSYGIFSGAKVRWATLRFSPHAARWVAAETWHPQQQGHWDALGCWVLELPYADPRELVKDILRHVPDVEVLAPPALQVEVHRRLVQALKQWQGTG